MAVYRRYTLLRAVRNARMKRESEKKDAGNLFDTIAEILTLISCHRNVPITDVRAAFLPSFPCHRFLRLKRHACITRSRCCLENVKGREERLPRSTGNFQFEFPRGEKSRSTEKLVLRGAYLLRWEFRVVGAGIGFPVTLPPLLLT